MFGFPAVPAVLLGLVLGSSVFLGYNINPLWYFGSLAGGPLFLWLLSAVRRKRRRHLLRQVAALREGGRAEALAPPGYRACFDGRVSSAGGPVVDERTCTDISLPAVFALLDRTVTIPGANMLYALLRVPLFDTRLLSRRRELTRRFIEEPGAAEELHIELGSLFHPGRDDVTGLLLNGPAERPPSKGFSILGTAAAAVSIAVVLLLNTSWAFLFPLAAFVMNMIIYYRHYGIITRQIEALGYVGAMVRTAGILSRNHHLRRLDEDTAEALRCCIPSLSAVRRQVNRITTFSPDSRDILSMLIAYIKIFFLVDIHAYRRFLALVENRREDILRVYELVGTLDALLSAAVFFSGRKDAAVPRFNEGTPAIEAEGMYHPLLSDPVANTFTLRPPGCVITGSNMAGKSTLLRTVALNILLAQTLGYCFARSCKTGLFFPVTSIEKHDSIALGKSLYYDEAKRIFDIIETTGKDVPVLCVIDELLSGTNSTERRRASTAILIYLAGQGALVISATHDLQTAGLLADLYDNRHFADRLDEGGLDFDYLLKPGILATCNAIDLLERIGFPNEVVEKARGSG